MAMIITINISDRDEIILKNDLLDIDDWVQKAVIGKINNSKKRLVRQGRAVLRDDVNVTQMPADDDGLVDLVTARSDYKDRTARDAAEAATRT